jgi:hypothetical protein
MTGFLYYEMFLDPAMKCGAIHGVFRLNPAGNAEPQLFAGRNNKEIHDWDLKELDKDSAGSDNEHFKAPTSVDCDAQGRVYVADYENDRIQVFSPDGKYLKTIPADKPAKVVLDRATGEIYVFSWHVYTDWNRRRVESRRSHTPARLTRFGPLDNPQTLATYAIPLGCGHGTVAELDFSTKPCRLWLVDKRVGVAYAGQDVGQDLRRNSSRSATSTRMLRAPPSNRAPPTWVVGACTATRPTGNSTWLRSSSPGQWISAHSTN